MLPRKKVKARVKIENSSTCSDIGWGRGAAAQLAPEEPASIVDGAPGPSVSEAESIASQMCTMAAIHLQAAQSSSDSDNERPPSEATQSHKKRRREMVTADFTERQEQEMVDWLQAPEQDCLLNKKHPNYIKKGLKDALWEQKAREMDKTSDQLKKWYVNMRSRFGKLKQVFPGSGSNELTARDCWILRHFEFLRPHLIVQVKKRMSMKAKVRARAAQAEAPRVPQCEFESVGTDHHPLAAAQLDAYTPLVSMPGASNHIEATRGNIAEMQRQILNEQNKLSRVEKSPMHRQKDIFADFMKEVTYTFPPTMWLRFQSEVNSLLQKYQLELHQQTPMQTQQLHQDDDTSRPIVCMYSPTPIKQNEMSE
ncbi:uncharacterized protein LOC106180640 [Lingula anatina]|uniref:Uncharacterized protein LOC106180640 n=1 Tax=Lingula anatina TaxID=7574 RepID=A0A1S3KBX0_LINAN|nr:uncharacterized protein LOC106180640 [Lingula anatina]|eukprot:XP_013420125.1 uncharacterized protein LOC106180640 [Lingula anatina]